MILGYIGVRLGLYWGYVGVILVLYWDLIGMMENKMKNCYLGFRAQASRVSNVGLKGLGMGP